MSYLVAVSTRKARIVLRELYWKTQDNASTLQEELKAHVRSIATEIGKGERIVSTSSAGKSLTLGNAGSDSSPSQAADVADRLCNLYDEVVDTLGDDTDDAATYTAMMLRLKPARFTTTSFSTFRSPR